MQCNKFLAFIMALAVCVPVGTDVITNDITSNISASADKLTTEDGNWNYFIDSTKNVVAIDWYNGSDACVVIPSEIDGYPVATISDFAFYCCGSLESITIPDSVTTIGFKAFNDCTSLKSVTIPSSLAKINSNAFQNCINIENVTIKLSKNGVYGDINEDGVANAIDLLFLKKLILSDKNKVITTDREYDPWV